MSPTKKKTTASKRPSTTHKTRTTAKKVVLLIATRKGAWLLHSDKSRKTWRVDGPHFLGQIINHLVLDPRDCRTLLAAR